MTLNEKATRKQFIDHALLETGWGPILCFDAHERYNHASVEEYPTSYGPADYLLYNNGQPVAIVEAKKLAVGHQNVLQQAQRYARGLAGSPFNFNGFHVPFIYSTNGEIIWFQDLRQPNSRSRKVAAFHTPAALQEMLEKDSANSEAWLRCHPIDHSLL